jgi:hypothetical protein
MKLNSSMSIAAAACMVAAGLDTSHRDFTGASVGSRFTNFGRKDSEQLLMLISPGARGNEEATSAAAACSSNNEIDTGKQSTIRPKEYDMATLALPAAQVAIYRPAGATFSSPASGRLSRMSCKARAWLSVKCTSTPPDDAPTILRI